MDMYDYVVCVTCDRRYQQIDFGCATHVLDTVNEWTGDYDQIEQRV